MRFAPTKEQEEFAAAIGGLMQTEDSVAVARSWAAGELSVGNRLWERLSDLGLTALMVPEEYEGLGGTEVDLAIACEALGHHLSVGPWIESAAFLATALPGDLAAKIAAGQPATVQLTDLSSYAEVSGAEAYYVCSDGSLYAGALTGDPVESVDRTRILQRLEAGESITSERLDLALNRGVLAAAAQLLGAGERVLSDAVSYAKQRHQFGRPIGSYQAIKHALADCRIALDFARPLLWGAALDPTARDVSAAKLACTQAADLAGRTALQVHGAIGYTAEYDLSLWLGRIRALRSAWGDPTWHRRRIVAAMEAVR